MEKSKGDKCAEGQDVMPLPFPLSDVSIRRVKRVRRAKEPVLNGKFWQVSAREFSMQVKGVGSFYAADGHTVLYRPEANASWESVALFLNGSVYGAILHQRQLMPLHGSCFSYNGRSIMLSGESGAGKSSLTVTFCRNGATFLTDDVTPVTLKDNTPFLFARSDRVKLWDSSMKQLDIAGETRYPLVVQDGKYYYPMDPAKSEEHELHMVMVVELAKTKAVRSRRLTGTEAFQMLRNQVYRWEYLVAMPQTEAYYMKQLALMTEKVALYHVVRPESIPLETMRAKLQEIIHRHEP